MKIDFNEQLSFLHSNGQLKIAYEIARTAHRSQKRRNGNDYFQDHVLDVFDNVNVHIERYLPETAHKVWLPLKNYILAGALLHDVVEDTPITIADLREKSVAEIVLEMVNDVTKRQGESYFDFITRVYQSPNLGSHAIKQADLEDNMEDLTPKDKNYDKYHFAFYILNRK